MIEPDLGSLLQRLLREKVDFVGIGGYAAVVHGSPMVTHDVDIGCSFEAENLDRLARALAGTSPVHRMTPRRVPVDLGALPRAGSKKLYLSTQLGQLDCVSELIGIGGFSEMMKHSSWFETHIGRTRILDLEALIVSEQALGRPRDLEAVKVPRAILAKRVAT
jgi:hypothetical protein